VEKIQQNKDEALYAFIMHDLVWELMPHIALRRDKHYKATGKKVIKCPYCSNVLTIVETTAKLELIRYSVKNKADVRWHKSKSCGICHNTVGIIYVA